MAQNSKINPLKDKRNLSQQTLAVHGGTNRSKYGETSESLFINSGFTYENSLIAQKRFAGEEDGYIYSRFSNPTVNMFEERMALIEGAEAARATASGMAAVSLALMSQLRAGDHVVAGRALFGSCRYIIEEYLPRWGISSTLVDGVKAENFAAAIRPNSKVIFIESPTNPTLELVDIEKVAKIAHENGAILIVDNVFASSILQKPLKLGADLVVYSATKHIDGQGRALGGIILGDKTIIEGDIHNFLRQTGPSISPFNAWIMLKGLETLELRVNKMSKNAKKIAKFLAKHKKIKRVFYPLHKSHPQYELAKKQMKKGSSIVSFEVKGDQQTAFKLADNLAIILISNNLGDAKSIISHPATTTHQRFSEKEQLEMGIKPSLLRLSVGLENVDDLIRDLNFALEQI